INATIRDKYYASASATPAAVFSTLLRGAQNHISKLRKDRKSAGLGYYFDQQMGEIIKKLPDHFPANLRIDDQGRFAIGYYLKNWTRREEKERTADIDNNVNGELDSLPSPTATTSSTCPPSSKAYPTAMRTPAIYRACARKPSVAWCPTSVSC